MKHAFNQIRESLTQEAMLDIPDPASPSFLNTDASNFAVGAVLSQRDKEGLLLPVFFSAASCKGREYRACGEGRYRRMRLMPLCCAAPIP